MLGFFLGLARSPGKGPRLGIGEISSRPVLPTVKAGDLRHRHQRVMRSEAGAGVADGWLSADGAIIYRAKDLKVGLFRLDEALQPAGRDGRGTAARAWWI